MKIKKIELVKNFGQLQDFKWNENSLKEFDKFNIFYGWNYSGKTTLSRLFRSIELKKVYPDYQNAHFSLITDNGDITEKNINNDYQIKVFNEDFIEDNFKWNNENAEIDPVLILGKESKELEKDLQKNQKQKKEFENEKNAKGEEKKSLDKDVDNLTQSKATEIRNILSITNPRDFDKNKLKEIVGKIKNNYLQNILSNDEVNNYRTFINSPKLDPINLPNFSLDEKLKNYQNEVKDILKKTVSVQKIIEKLKQDYRLSQWVKEGLELHKNENTCQFCGNKLTAERLEELNKHFSKEFDAFISVIDQKIKELDTLFDSINNYNLPDKARLYSEFKDKYESLCSSFNKKRELYKATIEQMKNLLKNKKEKPFDTMPIEPLENINIEVESEIKNVMEEIIEILKKHNAKVKEYDNERNKAIEKLKLHYVAEFLKDSDYFIKVNDIERLKNEIDNLDENVKEIENQILGIEKKIKKSTIGAEKLNEYLKTFFGDDRLKIIKTENDKYKLYRNDQIAKNLSTGEKNIISLIYFFTKLEETNFDIQNSVIFIDDPVSSLDSNHIHMVYAFLSKKVENIGQLFITTHNFDFFNLLKDMFRYDVRDISPNFYLIKKVKTDDKYSSDIENLPSILEKYKSEYNYLFSILKNFKESEKKYEFEQLFLLPNILRRFFEMYLFMKYPDGKKFNKKAKKYFENIDTNKKNMALKIMDEYSHEENIEHSLRFPDIQELIEAIDFVLGNLKEKDKEHFDALEDSIRQSNGGSSHA
jgi:wobble nucleotide-excising tRNase